MAVMARVALLRKAKTIASLARKQFTKQGRIDARHRRGGARLAYSAWAAPTAWLRPGCVVGPESWINHDVQVDSQAVIGRGVAIARGAYICTGTHEIGPSFVRAGRFYIKQTVIEDGCWIGAHAVVLPGVTVAKGCVVAAGAVVTRDTDPDGLYAGVPAVRIRDLE